MRPGLLAVKIKARSVGADIDRAQAHAARGLYPLLLIAVVDAGVDVEAAEAEAIAAVTPTMAPMAAVVKAASGSGRGSGKGEGSGGNQSDGNLAKHSVLQLSGAKAVVSSLHLRRSNLAIRSCGSPRIVFQECFVGGPKRPILLCMG